MKLNITPEDLLRGTIVESDWYPVEIKEVEESQAKTDGSALWTIKMNILSGKFIGVPLQRVFSEKAPGFAIEFLQACGAKIGKEGGEFELAAAKGKKILAHVVTGMYQNRPKNDVDSFKPLQ